jgi:hypothetical protein
VSTGRSNGVNHTFPSIFTSSLPLSDSIACPHRISPSTSIFISLTFIFPFHLWQSWAPAAMLPVFQVVWAVLAFITQTKASGLKVVSLDITQESAFPVAQSGLSSEILRARAQSVQATLFNAQSDLLYLVNITVGTPPQALQLQIDTGSSDIWLPWVNSPVCSGKIKRCNEGSYSNKASSTYHLLAANIFSISYVDNTKISGDYIQDVFNVGGVSIPKMTMGLAKTAAETETSSDFEGILGIGFDHGEAYYAQTGESYPNLISKLVSTGAIHTKAYSLFLNDRGELEYKV